ncbi:MAG: hypothetical protein NWF14_04475 [Candidatus Bathyarchaeota archaeon]|nr:hypothetical protein [Candidatus Bathyarchaeota archaeon]
MGSKDYGLNIAEFEELLQRITANMTSGLFFEKLPPRELWKKSEADVTALQSLAAQLRDSMLVLKPEKAPTIEKRTEVLLQPLTSFKERLFQKSDDPLVNSRLALDELRKAVMEGSSFLDLVKEIKQSPSESISAVLKLKEVYDAKEYLSTISVPEAAYVRFLGLRKNVETFKASTSNLERALGELTENLDRIVEEVSKFRPLPLEKSKEKPANPEASLKEAGSETALEPEEGE